MANGTFPVISQGKGYIDGYSNDSEKVINDTPAILFGDHTKVVKYISKPFIPGADGTKILKARCYPKYLYYLILYGSQNIEDRGYARHFSYLKEYKTPYIPNIEIQIEISSTLDYLYDKIDNIRIKNIEINILKNKIKNKILESIFCDSSSHKSYYEYRTSTNLEEYIDKNDIGDGDWILSKNMDCNGNIKLVQLKHIGSGKYIDKPYCKINNSVFMENKCSEIKENYLLINRLLSDRMNVCIMPDIQSKCITSVDVCWIKPNNKYLTKYLMYYLMSPYFQKEVTDLCWGSTRKRISKKNLIKIPMLIHNLKAQKEIVKKIEKIFTLIDSL